MCAAKAQHLIDSLIVIFFLVLDQVTKCWALAHLVPGKPWLLGSWIGIQLDLTLTTNAGAAWGTFAQFPGFLFCVRLIFIACLVFFYLRYAKTFSSRLAVLAILAGAVGNIIDSLFLGHVIDMIHVTLWGWDYPVFNIADTWIFLGCFTFLFGSFFEKKRV
jgi:signal peptidase II